MINVYGNNFIKHKQCAYIFALKLYLCKVLIGAGQVRRTFKTKLIQVNSDTPYSYM